MNTYPLVAAPKIRHTTACKVNSVTVVVFSSQGGMTHYAEMLVEPLRARLRAELYIALTPSPPALNELLGRFVGERSRRVFTQAARLTIKYRAATYRQMARDMVRRTNPQIVHITSLSVGLWPFVKELVSIGVRVVYTVHDPVPHEEVKTIWGALFLWGQRKFSLPRVFLNCSAIHVHSIIHADQLVVRYGKNLKSRLYVAQHGAGLPAAIARGAEVPPEICRLSPEIPTLLFFGRIEKYKGLGVLLEAVKIVDSNQASFNLVIAGGGDLPAMPRDLTFVNLVLANRFIRDAEVRSFFENCDVVVLPYTGATQSGVIPMAYAFSKPVIASRIGALKEVVNDGITGLLVRPGDPSDLANAILEFLAGRANTEKMGRAAQECGQGVLAWSAVADVHIQRYDRLLEMNAT